MCKETLLPVFAVAGQDGLDVRLLSMEEKANIKAILSRYRKHWQQRLLAHGICLLPLAGLVHRCFRSFSRQFLQIKTTPNLLFGLPT